MICLYFPAIFWWFHCILYAPPYSIPYARRCM